MNEPLTLTLNDAVTKSSVGLVLSDDLTHEDFIAIGRQFNRAADAYAWMLGDWVVYGQRRFKWGDTYTEAIEATGVDPQVLRNYAVTSRAIPLSLRSDNLSYSHHRQVQALDAEEQKHWLDQAERLQLSTRELTASIKEGKVMRVADLQAKRTGNQGLHGPHAIWATFNRAYRDCTDRVPFEKWTTDTRQAWKEQLRPIVELYHKL